MRAMITEYTYQVNISSMNNFDGILKLTIEGTNGTIGPVQLMTLVFDAIGTPRRFLRKLTERTEMAELLRL